MGNIFRRFFGKEDFVAVLEQLSKEIVETELRLRQYRIRWRKTTSRITYLFLALELAYMIYWYFFTQSGAPPMDTMIHIIVVASIPLLWYLIVLLIGAYYKYRISSTESLIEELSERQDSKIEEFKETGSYKEVARVLGSLDTPHRGEHGEATPRHPPSSTSKTNPPTHSAKRTSAGDKRDTPAPKATAAVPGAPKSVTKPSVPATGQKDSNPPLAAPATAAAAAAPSQISYPAHAKHNQLPATAVRPTPSSNGPSQPATPRLHLNPVPQSPYRHISAPNTVSAQAAAEPESRGWMDYLLDVLIGTSTTVPKICLYCGAHNGLVPVEEQNNVQFVCHMCKAFNAGNTRSRKTQSDASAQPQRDHKAIVADALKSRLSNNSDSAPINTESSSPRDAEPSDEPPAESSSAPAEPSSGDSSSS
jgi:hypothetical protein